MTTTYLLTGFEYFPHPAPPLRVRHGCPPATKILNRPGTLPGEGKNSAKVRGFQPLTFAKSSPLPAHELIFPAYLPAGRGRGEATSKTLK
jgi:hypothetical protein